MQLRLEEREKIAVWRSEGMSLRAIALKIGRSPSTISREINRNRKPSYWPHKAHERALNRLREGHRRPRLKSRVMQYEVEQMLKRGWSPELIAGRIKTHRRDLPTISHEAIYQWVYDCRHDLIGFLLRAHPRRRRRWKTSIRKTRIPDRKSIQARPIAVNQRLEPGHWETDLMVGPGRSALQVVVERQFRYTRIAKIQDKSAQSSRMSLERMLASLPPPMRRSITYDNGSENAQHFMLKKSLGLDSWFCEPYHSWEKGSVENVNGLIRRFIPKRTRIDDLNDEQIRAMENWLNNRPRKVLNFKTPSEAFASAAVALNG